MRNTMKIGLGALVLFTGVVALAGCLDPDRRTAAPPASSAKTSQEIEGQICGPICAGSSCTNNCVCCDSDGNGGADLLTCVPTPCST